jgi:hypothetical protein
MISGANVPGDKKAKNIIFRFFMAIMYYLLKYFLKIDFEQFL